MINEWATPIGYPSWVKVSVNGDVLLEERVVKRGNTKMTLKKKLLKKKVSRGYVLVQFRINGENRHFRVHRLVMLAHSGINGDKLDVNHKNGNKEDNHIDNLEWCTRSENLTHSYRVLGRIGGMKGKEPINKGVFNNKKMSKPVIGTNILNGEKITFPSVMEAKRNGFDSTGIFHCLAGDQKTSKGYTWEYQ